MCQYVHYNSKTLIGLQFLFEVNGIKTASNISYFSTAALSTGMGIISGTKRNLTKTYEKFIFI